MKKSFRVWFTLFLVLVISLSAGCPPLPDEVIELSREEAVSIAMEVPEFKDAAELGEVVSSLEDEVWIVKVIQWVGSDPIEHPVVHINSRTGEIVKVHRVPDIAARRKEVEYPIRRVLDTFVKAYNTHNLELLKLTLWEESSFYPQIVENATLDFARFPTIRITFTEIAINFYDDGRRAGVTLQEIFRGENDTAKQRQGVVLIEMIKTEDEWRIVSLHWPAMMIPEKP